MKKGLWVFAGLLVSLVAAMPLAVGIALEQAFNLLLRDLAATPAVGLGASRFERGYASSHLSIELRPLLDGTPQPLQLLIHLRHGPVLTGDHLTLGLLGVRLDLKAANTAQLQAAQEELYHLDGRMDLWGAARFTDRYNPLSLNLVAGRGQWSRGEGAGRFNWQAKRLDYEGSLAQLSWQSPNLTINLADTQIAKQISLTNSGLSWFSRVAFKALNAQLQANDYWLQRGALGVSGQLNGPLQNNPHRWQMSLVAETFKSKAVQLTSLDANLALEQVPSDGLLAWAALALSPQAEQAYAEQAFSLAQRYLQGPAALVVERVGAVQEEKTFWLTGRVELAPLAALPVEAWRTSEDLMAQLTGAGEIHLDKTLLPIWAKTYLAASGDGGNNFSPAQIEVLAKAFAGQGMLTEVGDHYSCRVAFKPGALLLNDKPVAMPF